MDSQNFAIARLRRKLEKKSLYDAVYRDLLQGRKEQNGKSERFRFNDVESWLEDNIAASFALVSKCKVNNRDDASLLCTAVDCCCLLEFLTKCIRDAKPHRKVKAEALIGKFEKESSRTQTLQVSHSLQPCHTSSCSADGTNDKSHQCDTERLSFSLAESRLDLENTVVSFSLRHMSTFVETVSLFQGSERGPYYLYYHLTALLLAVVKAVNECTTYPPPSPPPLSSVPSPVPTLSAASNRARSEIGECQIFGNWKALSIDRKVLQACLHLIEMYICSTETHSSSSSSSQVLGVINVLKASKRCLDTACKSIITTTTTTAAAAAAAAAVSGGADTLWSITHVNRISTGTVYRDEGKEAELVMKIALTINQKVAALFLKYTGEEHKVNGSSESGGDSGGARGRGSGGLSGCPSSGSHTAEERVVPLASSFITKPAFRDASFISELLLCLLQSTISCLRVDINISCSNVLWVQRSTAAVSKDTSSAAAAAAVVASAAAASQCDAEVDYQLSGVSVFESTIIALRDVIDSVGSNVALISLFSENDQDLFTFVLMLLDCEAELSSSNATLSSGDGEARVGGIESSLCSSSSNIHHAPGKDHAAGVEQYTSKKLRNDMLLAVLQEKRLDCLTVFYIVTLEVLCADASVMFDLICGSESAALEYLLKALRKIYTVLSTSAGIGAGKASSSYVTIFENSYQRDTHRSSQEERASNNRISLSSSSSSRRNDSDRNDEHEKTLDFAQRVRSIVWVVKEEVSVLKSEDQNSSHGITKETAANTEEEEEEEEEEKERAICNRFNGDYINKTSPTAAKRARIDKNERNNSNNSCCSYFCWEKESEKVDLLSKYTVADFEWDRSDNRSSAFEQRSRCIQQDGTDDNDDDDDDADNDSVDNETEDEDNGGDDDEDRDCYDDVGDDDEDDSGKKDCTKLTVFLSSLLELLEPNMRRSSVSKTTDADTADHHRHHHHHHPHRLLGQRQSSSSPQLSSKNDATPVGVVPFDCAALRLRILDVIMLLRMSSISK